LLYVRIIRMGSMVPCGAKRRGKCKELEALKNGDWIEGVLTKPVRVGDGFRMGTLIHNGQVCRRIYITSAVVAIQADQVLTCEVRYKFVRVPVFDPEQSLKSWE